MTTPKTPALLLALLLAAPLAATSAWAATQDDVDAGVVGEELPTDVSAPPEQNYQGILYRSGGADTDEREALATACRALSLKILFAHKGDSNFVAGVGIAITDTKGKKIFEAADTGPVLCVDLPKGGTYRVVATLNGAALEQTAKTGSAQKQIAFYF
jgi:hypothetical protein